MRVETDDGLVHDCKPIRDQQRRVELGWDGMTLCRRMVWMYAQSRYGNVEHAMIVVDTREVTNCLGCIVYDGTRDRKLDELSRLSEEGP